MSQLLWGTVQRFRGNRLLITTTPTPELVEWLGGHDAVADVLVDRKSGVIKVALHDMRALAGFARSLQDRMFAAARRTLTSPTTASGPFHVRASHAIPGRVRLGLRGLAEGDIERLAAWLAKRPGALRARPSPASRSVVVWFEETETSAATLAEDALASDPKTWPSVTPPSGGWTRAIANTGVLAAAIAIPTVIPPPVLGGVIAITGIPSLIRMVNALRERRIGIDALDVVAIGISIGTGRYATAALITSLLSIGDLILARTQARARRAISETFELDTGDAYRLNGTVVEKVSPKVLKVGDRIIIDTGARVAADGIVESGYALVDEKALTGESMPRSREKGDRVLCASVVVDGQMIVVVERVGADTTAMRIAQILSGAGTKPMTLQRNSERVADKLVVPTFGLAGGSAAATAQIDRMTSVLITDFGTGVRIAVPTAALTAMTLAVRGGVLVKGGQFLERLSKVDAIIFDKTGTLTRGEPEVVATDPLGSLSSPACLGFAAAAEGRQKHPIAVAIRRAAENAGASPVVAETGSEVVAIGRGVSARVEGHEVVVGGKRAMLEREIAIDVAKPAQQRHYGLGASTILVAVDGKLVAALAVADEPRVESKPVIKELRANGRRQVLLLSGDVAQTAEAIGRSLGVDRALGDLLPEDKSRIVGELQAEGRTVAMVGDGINDAPALAVADVGISLDGGTDLAIETADVVLLEGGLAKLPSAFRIADLGMNNVKRSLGIVLIPNAAAIALGALGLLPPAMAAIINNGSTVAAALAAIEPLLRQGDDTRKRRKKRSAATDR